MDTVIWESYHTDAPFEGAIAICYWHCTNITILKWQKCYVEAALFARLGVEESKTTGLKTGKQYNSTRLDRGGIKMMGWLRVILYTTRRMEGVEYTKGAWAGDGSVCEMERRGMAEWMKRGLGMAACSATYSCAGPGNLSLSSLAQLPVSFWAFSDLQTGTRWLVFPHHWESNDSMKVPLVGCTCVICANQ